MTYFEKGRIPALMVVLKGALFSMVLALSCTAMAQEPGPQANNSATVETEQVNINRADADTIARVLEGVGITRAEAIVDYREEFGEFGSMEELLMVNGVGEVTLRNNASRIILD